MRASHKDFDDAEPRLAGRIQLTTDGHGVYIEAVEAAFRGAIDYAMLIKQYGAERPGEARQPPQHRMSVRA